MTQAPVSQENESQRKDATKLTQGLQTNLGRSVGFTTAIQLLWLIRLTGSQPSH